MNHMIWNLFLQTGNVETYLLLKQIENEQQKERETKRSEEIATLETKM